MAWERGYSKAHPGKYGLLIDWETSGSDFGGDSSIAHQGLSFGALIVNTETWEEVDSLHCELRFDETKYKWTEGAQKIHGLTREYLAEHGMPREEALAALIELLMRYFAPGSKIMSIGHNVSFDNDFTMQLFRDHGLEDALKFHHVLVDTSGFSFALIGEYKSDVVFELLGGIDKRGLHNPLNDARACLAVLRNAKKIFTAGLTATA
jgi:DNA polymerase III epsilon subunit-like protein